MEGTTIIQIDNDKFEKGYNFNTQQFYYDLVMALNGKSNYLGCYGVKIIAQVKNDPKSSVKVRRKE